MGVKNSIKFGKQKLLLWLTFLLTTAFLPLHQAKAQFGIEILTAPFVFLAKLGTMFIIAIPLSWGFLAMSQIFLNWTSNPALTGAVTRNEFVQAGWTVVRDFSNMFFILIIVAIGIATALRIKQYEVKKTLPRLIGVAILINFSPVICGVVIDASNIIMNFFLTAGSAGFGEAMTLAQSSGSYMMNTVRNALGNWSEIWRGILFFKLIIIIIFNFFGAFVLFLLGMLFLMRHIALWILVILSPLAFLTFIFPSTEDAVFNRWRKEFINWCFIGVTAGFFLYLSQLMMHIGMDKLIQYDPSTDVTEFGGKIVSNLMIMVVPFIFLFVGYFVAIKSSAMGAGFVISGAKKMIGRVNPATKQGRQTLNRLRTEAGKASGAVVSKIPGVKRRAEQVIAKTPEKRREEWEKASGVKKVGKVLARTVMPYWARERMAGAIASKGGSQLENIDKYKEEADKLKSPEARRAAWKKAKREGNRNKQLGILQSAIDKKEMDNYSKEEIRDAIKKAGKINKKLAQKIMQVAPDVAQELYEKGEQEISENHNAWIKANAINDTTKMRKLEKQLRKKEEELERTGLWMKQEDKDRYGTLEEKLVLTAQTKDIGKMRKDYITSERAQKIIQDINHQGRNAWTGNKLAKMADEFEAPAVEAYNKVTDMQGNQWFTQNNPARKWIESSPGAYAAGYRPPVGPGGGPGGGGPGGGGPGGGGPGGGGPNRETGGAGTGRA